MNDTRRNSIHDAAITPIIVIGMIRSGTKWLSNLICNHPRVVGPQAHHHGGIIETNMFAQMEKNLGPLSNSDSRTAICELWPRTDLYRATGMPPRFVRELDPFPNSYLELYDLTMSAWGSAQGCDFWLQKTAPTLVEPLLPYLLSRNAKFILIHRDATDTLNSLIQHRQNKSQRTSTFRLGTSICIQNRLMGRLQRRLPDSLMVGYAELKRDTPTTLSRIGAHLGIEFDESMAHSRYQPNTSFDAGPRIELSTLSRCQLGVIAPLLAVVPWPVLASLQRRTGGRSQNFLSGTFSESNNGKAASDPAQSNSEIANE